MNCEKCGAGIDENTSFCTSCGEGMKPKTTHTKDQLEFKDLLKKHSYFIIGVIAASLLIMTFAVPIMTMFDTRFSQHELFSHSINLRQLIFPSIVFGVGYSWLGLLMTIFGYAMTWPTFTISIVAILFMIVIPIIVFLKAYKKRRITIILPIIAAMSHIALSLVLVTVFANRGLDAIQLTWYAWFMPLAYIAFGFSLKKFTR